VISGAPGTKGRDVHLLGIYRTEARSIRVTQGYGSLPLVCFWLNTRTMR